MNATSYVWCAVSQESNDTDTNSYNIRQVTCGVPYLKTAMPLIPTLTILDKLRVVCRCVWCAVSQDSHATDTNSYNIRQVVCGVPYLKTAMPLIPTLTLLDKQVVCGVSYLKTAMPLIPTLTILDKLRVVCRISREQRH
ncbi:hypothetical protein DPMN_182841 [Dreissena polymorpha]|uniref:Uncharacterized protein n=1 Tax=Dreissena polymorpha TaxID=45954 RepID=A0A9D4DGG5_DREPO|nr:hypothetical protein DPMN_182841 [Dreissena polymorpha]